MISKNNKSKFNYNNIILNTPNISKKEIINIYDKINMTNIDFTFDCKILPTIKGIKMVKIIYINSSQLDNDLIFYKLPSSYKLNNAIKNIWLPCNKNCLKKSKSKSKINTNKKYSSKYGVFMNKNNVIISKLLFKGFKE